LNFVLWDDAVEKQQRILDNDFILESPYELKTLTQADVFVCSSGLLWDKIASIIFLCKQYKNLFLSDLGLLGLIFPQAKLYIVTGSCGKTTTVSLVHFILQEKNIPHLYGGNVGIPLFDCVLHGCPDLPFIVEASSFQLEWAPHLPIVFGCVTSLYQSKHQDMHQSDEAYYDSKMKVFTFAPIFKRGIMDLHGFCAERTFEKVLMSFVSPETESEMQSNTPSKSEATIKLGCGKDHSYNHYAEIMSFIAVHIPQSRPQKQCMSKNHYQNQPNTMTHGQNTHDTNQNIMGAINQKEQQEDKEQEKQQNQPHSQQLWTARMDFGQSWISSYGDFPSKIFPPLFRGTQKKWNDTYPFMTGAHNRSNAFAAYGLVELLGVSAEDFLEDLKQFHRPLYRQTLMGEDKNNILWINDSKATDIHATIAAIKNFVTDYDLVLIMGGKNNNIFPISSNMKYLKKIKHIMIYGEVGKALFQDKMHSIFEELNIEASYENSFKEAVKKAYSFCRQYKNLEKNQLLDEKSKSKKIAFLLSPGWQSFDQHIDYKARGKEFEEVMLELNT
jgi:UDP-N-acetylmuramoylalanine-D-glutamate ligase